jgi:hypothetical protein
MFVLMPPNNPIPSHLNVYADLQARFWYWRGASGNQYIHSVYKPRNCPPLPGGVYIAVTRIGDMRQATGIGLFSDFWDIADPVEARLRTMSADEIHVHLLARTPDAARAVAMDLDQAMRRKPAAASSAALTEPQNRVPRPLSVVSAAKARAA